MKCQIYLTFNGDCEEAMNFYSDVLDGEISLMSRFVDMPPHIYEVSEEQKNLIMHCTMEFHGCTLMASDTVEPENLKIGTNATISINTDEASATSIFNSLKEGGKELMPFEDAFWGGKFGMLADKYGVQWMVSSEHK